MSETISVGVVPVGNWHCMAVQMAESLRRVADGTLALKDFPGGALLDAAKFFASVREEVLHALLGRTPSNPPASISNWRFAADAYAATANTLAIDETCYGDQFHALLLFSHFIELLRNPHELTAREAMIAAEAANFFEKLAQMGSGRALRGNQGSWMKF